jgi:hypothetical protein
LLRTPGGSLLWYDAGGMGREASEDDTTAEPPPTEEEEEQEEDAARSAAEIARSREERGRVGGVTLWDRGRKGKEGEAEEEAVEEEKEVVEGKEEEEEEEEEAASPVREATTPGRMAFTPGGRVRAALSPIPQEVGRPRDGGGLCSYTCLPIHVCTTICVYSYLP